VAWINSPMPVLTVSKTIIARSGRGTLGTLAAFRILLPVTLR
jgi:hypothetical protein